MSDIQHLITDEYLLLKPSKPCLVLSSAALNGGLCESASFLNLKVTENSSQIYPSPIETLSQKADQLSLPAPTTAMMTAALMATFSHSIERYGELMAQCWVTTGLSNVRRVGDMADESAVPGTINIFLYVNQTLTSAAHVEAMMMLTESKVTAIRDAGIMSLVSGLPASGTGTDSHAVFCPTNSGTIRYCGKHTIIGELIGKAVLTACRESIEKCLD